MNTTQYTTVTPAQINSHPRRFIDANEQWKFEAATRVTPACVEKGVMTGTIEYPNGKLVFFRR